MAIVALSRVNCRPCPPGSRQRPRDPACTIGQCASQRLLLIVAFSNSTCSNPILPRMIIFHPRRIPILRPFSPSPDTSSRRHTSHDDPDQVQASTSKPLQPLSFELPGSHRSLSPPPWIPYSTTSSATDQAIGRLQPRGPTDTTTDHRANDGECAENPLSGFFPIGNHDR